MTFSTFVRLGSVFCALAILAAGCASTPRVATGDAPNFVSPVSGIKTSSFSSGGPGRRKHDGIDLGAAYDTPIQAAADGRVVEARRYGAYGLIVTLDHGRGWRTMYAHLAEIHVRKGQRVAVGDLIGQVGTSGNATGPHLHLEVSRHGELVDPERVIRFR